MNKLTQTILLLLLVGLQPFTAMAHVGHHSESVVVCGLLHMFIDHGYLIAGMALAAGLYFTRCKTRD